MRLLINYVFKNLQALASRSKQKTARYNWPSSKSSSDGQQRYVRTAALVESVGSKNLEADFPACYSDGLFHKNAKVFLGRQPNSHCNTYADQSLFTLNQPLQLFC